MNPDKRQQISFVKFSLLIRKISAPAAEREKKKEWMNELLKKDDDVINDAYIRQNGTNKYKHLFSE